jgi:hypothetical protein
MLHFKRRAGTIFSYAHESYDTKLLPLNLFQLRNTALYFSLLLLVGGFCTIQSVVYSAVLHASLLHKLQYQFPALHDVRGYIQAMSVPITEEKVSCFNQKQVECPQFCAEY